MLRIKNNEEKNNGMNANQLITVADLEKFKVDLLAEIRQIVKSSNGLPSKKWLKSSEVMKLLHISPGKLQTMRKSGVLCFMRIGGSIYYEQEDINRMFEKNKVNQN
ncbi:Helix-turn-helix domain-containing protein [Mucilaginibacter pineti]|uniref:Helix-turn-helix domain-containing protein n=1 Tax=Mucilaginibacter pineti TaxID=1391627 RepID=A0A1G7GKG2_9SPHI|nr:helix-turn-helix domain-containing protein [Mucilaginibacter pineti]SDE88620.1 Helix-turn-helix domain-containing protein [Mucilaginibacter pineti]